MIQPQKWMEEAQKALTTYAIPIGGKIIGAILLWIVGRIIISAIKGMIHRTLERRKVDDLLVTSASDKREAPR